MAVQMRAGASADLMQTNMAQTSRKTEQGSQNELSAGDGFKNFLDGSKNLSSVKNSQNGGSGVKHSQSSQTITEDVAVNVTDDVRRVVDELREDERFEKALAALDKEIGSGGLNNGTASEDVKELAQKVLDGEIDIDDIPDDISAEELMKELIALMMRQRLYPDKEDEEEQMFDPATAAVNEQNLNREASSRLLSELYKLIEKHNEEQSKEKVTILDGISESIDIDETTASIATSEIHAEKQAQEGVFEQIIDNMAETARATEEVETVESIELVEAVTAHAESAPAVQTQPNTSNLQNVVSEAAAEGAEQAVQAVEQGSQSNGAQMQLSRETQKTDEVGESVDTSEFDDVIESFTVKETKVSEPAKTENPVTANVTGSTQVRVQNASEELEMLKSAKLGKKDAEGDAVPTETASPLVNDQPIVFARADGTEIEVKPSEIIDQTARLIETAIEETQQQSEYSLILNPEELGRITVKLIKAADGAVSVTIAAENAHTQRVLEQHSELMQNNLRANGTNLASWQTVSESRQETYAQDYNGSSKNPYFRRDDAQHTDEDNTDTTFADIIAAM